MQWTFFEVLVQGGQKLIQTIASIVFMLNDNMVMKMNTKNAYEKVSFLINSFFVCVCGWTELSLLSARNFYLFAWSHIF